MQREKPSLNLKPARNKKRKPLNLRLSLQSLEDRVVPTNFIWTGLGTDANFSTAGNWISDNPMFLAPTGLDATDNLNFDDTAGTQRTAVNDLLVANFNSITISASGYTIQGREITLGDPATPSSGNIVVNSGATGNTIRADIRLGGSGVPGNRQFITVNTLSNLTITGSLVGDTGVELVKAGDGLLTLSADNSGFTGAISLSQNSGITAITNANALGDTAAVTTIENGATLRLDNVAGPINENLIINGLGVANGGALLNGAGTNTWAGSITLDSTSTFGSDAGTLRITGVISDLGSGHNVIKEGISNVTFVNDNTYRGLTTINNGVLTIQSERSLGAEGLFTNRTIVTQTLTKAGTLQIDDPTGVGFTVLDEILELNGVGAGGIGALNNLRGDNQWANSVIIGGPLPEGLSVSIGVTNTADELLISGVIDDPNGTFNITKILPGQLIFNNANLYAGTTTVAAGRLTIRDSNALGLTTGASFVTDGATLELEVDSGFDPHGRDLGADSRTGVANRITVQNEDVTLNGRGVNSTFTGSASGVGALRSLTGINTWTGRVILANANSDVAIGVEPDATQSNNASYFTNDDSLTITGNITTSLLLGGGGENVTLIKRGTGHLILPNANTYLAVTDIEQGWITVQNGNALGGLLNESGTVQPETLVRAGASLHIKSPTPAGSITLRENLILFGNGITHANPLLNGRGAVMSIGGTNTISGDVELNGVAGIGVEQVDAGGTSELNITGDVMDFNSFKAKHSSLAGDTEANIVDLGTNTGRLVVEFAGFAGDQLRIYQPPRGFPGATTPFFTSPAGSTSGFFQIDFTGSSNLIEIVMNETPGAGGWQYDIQLLTSVAGGINKFGGKRLRLAGNNSYSGAVNVQQGVLAAADDSAFGASSGGVTINAGGAIELESGPAPNNGGLANAGIQIFGESLTLNSSGNTSLTGTLIHPITVVERGFYTVDLATNPDPGDNDAMWRGSFTLGNDTVIDTRGNSRLLMLGNITDSSSGGVGITKIGTGELVLNGVNTYRGMTNINEGIVTIQSSQALGAATMGTVVAMDAALQIQGNLTIAGEALTVQGNGVQAAPSEMPVRWYTLGPTGITNGETPGNDRVSGGRVTSIAVDPSDDRVIYIATATGGAWKTKDGGITWTPMFDSIISDAQGNPLPMQSMFLSNIVVDPINPSIIYVTTGEGNNAIWYECCEHLHRLDYGE
jgi:autotransporter-associated beta strand protein